MDSEKTGESIGISIVRCARPQGLPRTVLDRVRALRSSIRKRALALIGERSGGSVSDLQVWLQAERDVAWMPAHNLLERPDEYEIWIVLPDFHSSDLQAYVTWKELVIIGDLTNGLRDRKDRYPEVTSARRSQFLRHFKLRDPIDVERVRASLEKGVLRIIAPKRYRVQHLLGQQA